MTEQQKQLRQKKSKPSKNTNEPLWKWMQRVRENGEKGKYKDELWKKHIADVHSQQEKDMLTRCYEHLMSIHNDSELVIKILKGGKGE